MASSVQALRTRYEHAIEDASQARGALLSDAVQMTLARGFSTACAAATVNCFFLGGCGTKNAARALRLFECLTTEASAAQSRLHVAQFELAREEERRNRLAARFAWWRSCPQDDHGPDALAETLPFRATTKPPERCPICWDEKRTYDRVLGCGHGMCEDCVKAWFVRAAGGVCPVCRTRVRRMFRSVRRSSR